MELMKTASTNNVGYLHLAKKDTDLQCVNICQNYQSFTVLNIVSHGS